MLALFLPLIYTTNTKGGKQKEGKMKSKKIFIQYIG